MTFDHDHFNQELKFQHSRKRGHGHGQKVPKSRVPCLFHDREAVLANATKRAGPAVRDGLKGGAGSDAIIGIAFFWVINVTADVANVLFHIDLILSELIVFGFDLEERLRVIANWAYLRSFLTDNDVAAVGALPNGIAIAREDDAIFNVFQQSEIAFLVLLFYFGDQFEEHGYLGEAFLAGGLGHTGIHVGPLVVLASGGIFQIGLGIRHIAIMQELEPNLGMFLLVTCRFLKKVGDLVVTFLTGLRGIVSILVAGL